MNWRQHFRTIPGWLLMILLAGCPAMAGVATGRRGVAATVHPRATAAALKAMETGGNAIDGAVAAALTLGVVDGHNSGIGGGCFLLIRLANGQFVAMDGRETAPAAATRDMYLRDGKADPRLSQTGALAAGVPGALAAYQQAVTHWGKLPLSRSLLEAARVAAEGFPIDRSYAKRLAETAEELRLFPEAAAIFLHADGSPLSAGEMLRQPDLARTYRTLAAEGPAWFYGGDFASATADWMRQHGGLMTVDDFRRYRAQRRKPIRTAYRGYEVVGFPPPSSGGVLVAQILNMLEHFELKPMGYGSTDFVHVTTEAMKLAFADRAYWLGDPDFTPVPRGLASKEYAWRLAGRIDVRRASPVAGHGSPARAEEQIFGKHTTHLSVADAEGNWVACTATINTAFGAKVVVPKTGVLLNNQMDDFAIQPGVSNYFGLVGAEANAVGSGKRPLSSMSPTIVLKDGRPILAVGAAGGPTIISQTLLCLLATLDFGLPLEAALAQPRFHHQWSPDRLRVERRFNPEVLRDLERRGHRLFPVEVIGTTQAVGWDEPKACLIGAHDPRNQGQADGF